LYAGLEHRLEYTDWPSIRASAQFTGHLLKIE
jgi:hypothetical protein